MDEINEDREEHGKKPFDDPKPPEKRLQAARFYVIITKQLKKRPCGQAVKTAPSHGAIPGSIPGKVTT